MLKFVRHHMDTISGVGIYPLISFVIFFSFFLVMLWWVRRVSRAHIDHMAALPMDPDMNQEANDHAH